MNKLILSFILNLLLLLPSAYSSGKEYAVSAIPAELTNSAKIIYRNYHAEYSIRSAGKAKLEVTYAVTLLEGADLSASYFIQYYHDELSKIKNYSGAIYNKDGKRIKKIKYEDFADIKTTGSSNVTDDSRTIFCNPNYPSYPFTVEYTFTIDFNSTLFLNGFEPVWYHEALEEAIFKVKVDNDLNFKYQEYNTQTMSRSTEENQSVYTWKFNHIKAKDIEEFQYNPNYDLPKIIIGIENFKVLGTAGNSSSWASLGDWVARLNTNRQKVSDKTKEEIHHLIKDVDNPRDRAKLIYQYFQGKIRYVSIQEGIGSWQPMKAYDVDANLYGDCKALSNYMKALLSIADIPSDYALIKAGTTIPYFNKDFVASTFNHAILRVNIPNDTFWMECTSKDQPFGYLGNFTDDRPALIIRDNGQSYLTQTPICPADQNIKEISTLIHLEDNKAIIDARFSYTGTYFDNYMHLFLGSEERQKTELEKILQLTSGNILNSSKAMEKSGEPKIDIQASIDVHSFGTQMSDRLLIPIFVYGRNTLTLNNSTRKNPFEIQRGATEILKTKIQIPENYEMIKGDDIVLDTKFGKYVLKIIQNDQNIEIERRLVLHKGNFAAADYGNFVYFINAVHKYDYSSLVLKNKS